MMTEMIHTFHQYLPFSRYLYHIIFASGSWVIKLCIFLDKYSFDSDNYIW